ncbi:hypothetical protein TREES_T100017982 [Tupaia chinensis]|uniref:Uncharacterized protein n=1 Tax=Tupaia chinensis TaxID=246437 RepID=L9JE61_TUPCH|nr:hypothetical protein TREES_T100017982 [Tupaia chinensis]
MPESSEVLLFFLLLLFLGFISSTGTQGNATTTSYTKASPGILPQLLRARSCRVRSSLHGSSREVGCTKLPSGHTVALPDLMQGPASLIPSWVTDGPGPSETEGTGLVSMPDAEQNEPSPHPTMGRGPG